MERERPERREQTTEPEETGRDNAATKIEGVPIRTCTGCRKRRPQAELIRITVQPHGGIRVRREGIGPRLPGRGAYVCPEPSCVDAALRSSRLRRTLRYVEGLPSGLHEELLRVAAEKGANG